MADIDELSSDSDDEEYVPEGGTLSSGDSDASEGEPEEALAGLGKRRSQRQAKKASNTQQHERQKRVQRSGRCTFDEKESSGDVIKEGSGAGEDSEAGEGSEASKEEKDKSRIDDLWASFKRDTGLKTQKTLSPTSKPVAATVVASGTTTNDNKKAAQGKGITETDSSAKDVRPKKTIKVKQKYDFAGEEVEVEKEVAVDSEEAKAYLHTQQQRKLSEKTLPVSLAGWSVTGKPSSRPEAGTAPTKGILTGSKRSSGLSAVLQSMGKKPKLSTLDKSHLDWQKYKEKEGLEDELAQHGKDGYLDKQAFLQRADVRQFELEREERLKRFRKIC